MSGSWGLHWVKNSKNQYLILRSHKNTSMIFCSDWIAPVLDNQLYLMLFIEITQTKWPWNKKTCLTFSAIFQTKDLKKKKTRIKLLWSNIVWSKIKDLEKINEWQAEKNYCGNASILVALLLNHMLIPCDMSWGSD